MRRGVLTASSREPLIPGAALEVQSAAVCRFLISIRSIGVRFAGQEDLLQQALSRIGPDGLQGDRAILLAVAVADYCLFDEMRPSFDEDYPWSDEAAPYHRFYAYGGWVPPRVSSALAKRHPGYGQALFGRPEHVFDLAHGAAGAGMLTPELAYWVDHPRPLPPCCVPRQVFFASLLACGVNPLDDWTPAVPARAPRCEPMPRHVKKSGRLIRWLAAGRADAGKVLSRTATHWGALMAEELSSGWGPARPAIMTSSGSAANEGVILSLSRVSPGLALVDPSWYFENIHSVTERHFAGRTSHQIERCRTFFVNLEPITFCRQISSNERPANSLTLLESIGDVARSAPNRTFYLVVDVTTSPCMRVGSALSRPLPPNVILYKTNSITKHQNGSRNYTCGAITISTPDESPRARLEQDLLDACRQVGGEIHPIHAVNIPRTRRESIDHKRSCISHLNRAVARALDPGSEGRIVPYTYHSFLFPSREVLRRLASETLQLALAGGHRSRREFEMKAGAYLYDRNRLLAARLREIEYGNSFGLPRSRIVSQDCAGLEVCSGLAISVCVFRLCPGYEADEDRLIEETRFAQEFLEESFDQLTELASSIRQKATEDWILHG